MDTSYVWLKLGWYFYRFKSESLTRFSLLEMLWVLSDYWLILLSIALNRGHDVTYYIHARHAYSRFLDQHFSFLTRHMVCWHSWFQKDLSWDTFIHEAVPTLENHAVKCSITRSAISSTCMSVSAVGQESLSLHSHHILRDDNKYINTIIG